MEPTVAVPAGHRIGRGDAQKDAAISNLGPVDDEDQKVSGGDPDDDWFDEGNRFRGWIPPDDRLWRHPSESASSVPGYALSSLDGAPPALSHTRTGPWVVGGATVCFVLVLVTAGLVMASTGRADQSTPSTIPGVGSLTGAPTTEAGMAPVASSAEQAILTSIRPSTVALVVVRRTGTSVTTGLVAESGGVIVTASKALVGARSITAVEPNGTRQPAAVVGVDRNSGVGVLRIADDLPAAIFNDGDLSVGTVVMAVAMEPGPRALTALARAYVGTVHSVGIPLSVGAVTSSFAATVVSTPLATLDIGCPLLAKNGDVSGILEEVMPSGASTLSVFLPAEVVLGVARQLVSSGTVDHGWLGVAGSDSTTSPVVATVTPALGSPGASSTTSSLPATRPSAAEGAHISAIRSGSPAAAGGLEPGDVVVGIDGYQVHSIAELRTRLYPDPPGTALDVTYQRAGTTLTSSVVLGSVGTDAPGDESSS